MRTSAFVTVAALVSLCVSGCGWFGGKNDTEAKVEKSVPGRVAVVDLDEIARRVGRDQYMIDTLKQTQQTLNERLEVVQASYVKQIKQKQETLGVGNEGVEITDEDTKTLLGMQREAGLNLNQARKEAISSLTQRRTQLVASFRNEVRPIASEVAKEKGLSIVLTKNDTVLFTHEDAVDITDEVAKRLRTSGLGSIKTAQQPRPLQPATQGAQPR
jgi:Skp family chaperone for outer membrane proteins